METVVRTSSCDVAIVGGGPAGLSAALILGRCRRRVSLFDAKVPRNWAAKEMHAYLLRDGLPTRDMRRLAHQELARYDTVTVREGEVVDAAPRELGFEVSLADGSVFVCRKLLIATGVLDEVPKIDGFDDFFGHSAFQCPYCDGWEMRGKPIAVYGRGSRAFEMGRSMLAWCDDIVVCSDGPSGLTRGQKTQLEANGVGLRQDKVARLEGSKGQLERIVFANGEALDRKALFFDLPSKPQSDLVRKLGCRFNKKGGVYCSAYAASSVPGLYVAGNILRDVQLAVVAAAEGAKAAFGINLALTREDFECKATGKVKLEHSPLIDEGTHLAST